jgi:uncharacterized protein
MEFDNSFEVPLAVEDAWRVLMDIRRIAPCMPGAELTEVVDDRTYKGRIAVRLGPVALAFAGTVKFEEIDESAHRARVSAQGSDAKGRGAANAAAAFHLEPAGNGGTKVLVHTNLTLSGAVAQYGRGVGIIQITAGQIITQFANNLKAQLALQGAVASAANAGAAPTPAASASPPGVPASASTAAPAPSAPAASAQLAVAATSVASTASPAATAASRTAGSAAKPISGVALMARVLWEGLKRLFGWRQSPRL